LWTLNFKQAENDGKLKTIVYFSFDFDFIFYHRDSGCLVELLLWDIRYEGFYIINSIWLGASIDADIRIILFSKNVLSHIGLLGVLEKDMRPRQALIGKSHFSLDSFVN
jgi:hypothetical protein